MRFWLSCAATFELLHCDILFYIHFNDEASSKG